MKRIPKILIVLVAVLVVARLVLPYVVLRYVNKTLASMKGYTGHVADIDIQLIRGAYQIDSMQIRKLDGKLRQPFLMIPKTDLSIQWKALFKGRLVSEVECYRPEINFTFSSDKASQQTGADVDWTAFLRKLLPIKINRFAVVDGTVNLTSLLAHPRADLSFKRFQGEIRNIRNIDDQRKLLPSPVVASGDVPGYGGTMNFYADMNLLKVMPDFDYKLRLNNLQLVKLNNLAREFANLDFNRGTVSIYSEMAMFDKKLNGYLKPLTRDMQIFKLNEQDHRSVGKFFTELLAQGAIDVLKNQRHNQVATRIPLSGTVDEVKTFVWPTIFGVLSNAYIEAFKKDFDNNVTLKDALQSFRQDRKEKRDERKAERKERRAERKAERKAKRAERKKETH